MSNLKFAAGLIVGLGMSITSFIMASSAQAGDDVLSEYVDNKGQISLPTDFRNTMAHLGSWYVPEGGASGFHDVYVDKSAVKHYRRTGKFPDGATIIKELRAATNGDYTTGTGIAFANSQLKQWFVMVKDSENRFESSSDIWGDGWGWALFKPDNPKVNVAANYKVDCLGCHIPAKGTDWVYTEAYPTLTSP